MGKLISAKHETTIPATRPQEVRITIPITARIYKKMAMVKYPK